MLVHRSIPSTLALDKQTGDTSNESEVDLWFMKIPSFAEGPELCWRSMQKLCILQWWIFQGLPLMQENIEEYGSLISCHWLYCLKEETVISLIAAIFVPHKQKLVVTRLVEF